MTGRQVIVTFGLPSTAIDRRVGYDGDYGPLTQSRTLQSYVKAVTGFNVLVLLALRSFYRPACLTILFI